MALGAWNSPPVIAFCRRNLGRCVGRDAVVVRVSPTASGEGVTAAS